MVEKKTWKFVVFPVIVIFFFLAIAFFDHVENFLAVTPLIDLIIIVGVGVLTLTLGPTGIKILKYYLTHAGKPKPLKEKECRKIALEWVAKNAKVHSVAQHDLNIISQQFDGDQYDNPFCFYGITTEKFPGTKKVRMDEVLHDKLFVIYIDRLAGIPTFRPDVDNEEKAVEVLNQLRLNALSYDKTRRISEIEQLVKQKEAEAFGQEIGKELAEKKK